MHPAVGSALHGLVPPCFLVPASHLPLHHLPHHLQVFLRSTRLLGNIHVLHWADHLTPSSGSFCFAVRGLPGARHTAKGREAISRCFAVGSQALRPTSSLPLRIPCVTVPIYKQRDGLGPAPEYPCTHPLCEPHLFNLSTCWLALSGPPSARAKVQAVLAQGRWGCAQDSRWQYFTPRPSLCFPI